MDLSLPQIIDLTTHQRRRAERALAVVRRHLTAQEQKVERMRDFRERLPELVTDQTGTDGNQLVEHQKAARREYEEAVQTMEKLQERRKKLQEKVQAKIEIERTMETLSTTENRNPFAEANRFHRPQRRTAPNVIPMATSRDEQGLNK